MKRCEPCQAGNRAALSGLFCVSQPRLHSYVSEFSLLEVRSEMLEVRNGFLTFARANSAYIFRAVALPAERFTATL